MVDKNDEEMSILGDGSLPVSGTPRWNPTKEQINLLEGLYRQGMRTPSAEQIQEITSRLKVYGHIEGKNVFYWFQNHKARQRQRQRQKLETMTHFNNFNFHRHQHYHNNVRSYSSSAAVLAPLLPSPLPASNNVTGSPFYIPQGGVGYFPQYNSKVLLPRRPATGAIDYSNTQHESMVMSNNKDIDQTLPLFPLHPTGILDDKLENSFVSASSANQDSSNPLLRSSEFGVDHCNEGNQTFIDFFAHQ